MTSPELLLCLFLIATSAFVSASEVALFSLSRFQLRAIRERMKSTHRTIKRLLSDPGGLLMTILVVNELVNISLSTLVAETLSRTWNTEPSIFRRAHLWLAPQMPEWIAQMIAGIVVTTPIVLLLCDMTPKSLAARTNQFIAPLAASPLAFLYDLLRPIRVTLKRAIRWVARKIGNDKAQLPDPETPPAGLKEEEFIQLLEDGRKEGSINEDEAALIQRVFDLDDTRVLDVATPIHQVFSLTSTTTVKAALQTLRTGGRYFSRIPVTGPQKKQILGVLYSKDLVLSRSDQSKQDVPISELMRKPLRIASQTRLNALFRRLKQTQMHLAVIENDDGSAAGIITMSDVLDALFEDVFPDEGDALSRSKEKSP